MPRFERGGWGPWLALFLLAVTLASSCLGERGEDLAPNGGRWAWEETPSVGVMDEGLPSGWSVRRFVVMDAYYFLVHLSVTGIAPTDGEAITYETPGGDVFVVHIYVFPNATLAEEDHRIYALELAQIFDQADLDLGEEGFLFRSRRGAQKGTFTGYLSFRRGKFFALYSLINVPLGPPMAMAGLQDRKLSTLGSWSPSMREMRRASSWWL